MTVERGATICRLAGGGVGLGPVAIGRSGSQVDVPISCPPGGTPIGLWHTHPRGKAELSSRDIAAGIALSLEVMCVTVPETGQTRCFPLRRRR